MAHRIIVAAALLTFGLASITSSQTKQTTAPPPKAAADSTAYVCPMHPKITSSQPGECSKCGMDLVKRKPAPNPATKSQKRETSADSTAAHERLH